MRFGVLGPLEVSRDGDRIALGGPKQRLVLAHLLIRANEVVSADLLIDEMWGDEPPDAARASLHSYVSHLKKAVGDDRLVSRPPGYILRVAAEEIDAGRFEALVDAARRRLSGDPAGAARTLREALELWQGEPFADLAHELSLVPEIERLNELRLGAMEDRLEAELALGRHAELVSELERLVGRHPLRERLCAQLMLALYRSGRQAEALAAYHRLRTTLDDELGIEPSPAIEELQRRILNHDRNLELEGEPLRGYRLVEQVGAGPLGVVHRAHEPQTERELAIKVLGPAVSNDPAFIRRFNADARRIARLEHPHIVALHDWWREPDAAYLVMRLLRGGSLAERLARGQFDSTTALRWAEQLGGALAAAHRQGAIHGDLRPGNVLLDADDNAYLSDFAIGYDPARLAGGGNGRADLRYLAPERQSGEQPTAAADIYALAVLLGELLPTAADGAQGAPLRAALDRATSATAGVRQLTAADLIADVRRALLTSRGDERAPDESLPTRNPYKGLRAFEESDSADFFGREALVGRLVDRMAEKGESSRLLVVVGPSGSGKSSVIAAGLVPALRSGVLPGSEDWFIATMTPGERPFDTLEHALLGVDVDSTIPLSRLLDGRAGLGPVAERILPAGAVLALVIDQFEELFTLVHDSGTQERFMQLLAATIDDIGAPIRLIITLRADFYDRPLRHERFGRQLAARTEAVPPLTPEELERAVIRPAERAGLQLEPGLVARIVAEMGEHAGGLPLLQYTLAELWERRDGRRLSLRSYDASGGITGAIGRRAEQLVRALDAEGREVARQLFLRLVELGEGTPDTARRLPTSDVYALSTDRMRMRAVMDDFARYRLLLFDRDAESRQPTVELAHEALLRAWPRLQQWVDEARDDLRRQRRLAAAAGQWLESGRDASYLLSGSRLEQATEWKASTRVLLAQAETEYVAASAAEDERRRAHETRLERRSIARLRALVVTLALGALLAGVLSVFALSESERAERSARESSARELAAAAVANLDVDPERSILLALEATDTTRGVDGTVLREAEEALHWAIATSRVTLTVPGEGGYLAVADHPELGEVFVTQGIEESGVVTVRSSSTGESVRSWRAHQPDVNDVALSPDGLRVATTGDDGYLRVWLTATGQAVAAMGAGTDAEVWGPSFSPDGTLVAAAWLNEGRVEAFDTSTGRSVLTIGDLDGPWRTAFSPDGSRLAVATVGDWPGYVFDATTGTEVMELEGHEGGQLDIAWSPDGRWLATASNDTTAKVWDVGTGALHSTLFGHTDEVWDIDWSPDSFLLVTGSRDGQAKVWAIHEEGPESLWILSSQDLRGGVGGVAFSPDGTHILTGQMTGQAVKIWDIEPTGTGELLVLLGDQFSGISFTPDGAGLVASSGDGAVTAWELSTGRPLVVAQNHDGIVFSTDVRPDGALVASVGQDGLAVWETTSGHERFAVTLDKDEWSTWKTWMQAVAWTPDGKALAYSTTTGSATVVDADGELVRELPEGDGVAVWAARFSPDGRLLATAVKHALGARWDPTLHRVTVWDWQGGTQVCSMPTSSLGLDFDPTSSLLATTSVDEGYAEIWDATSCSRRATLTGHSGSVGDAAWNPDPDRNWIATASGDATVRIWDAGSAATRLVLRGHEAPIWQVRFSPDGSRVASSSQDGTIRIWTLDLDELIAIAERKLTRGLTDEECREYLRLEACLSK
jgi:WD40 repeat protein/DNA-binding SARP family transcriptional activator